MSLVWYPFIVAGSLIYTYIAVFMQMNLKVKNKVIYEEHKRKTMSVT